MKVSDTRYEHRGLCFLVVLVLLLGCSRNNPKDGYQGVAWGSPESVAIQRGLHCANLSITARCTGKGRLGSVSVTENFLFGENRLRNVIVEASPEEFVALKDFFNQKYGGSRVVESKGHRLLEWDTETTSVSLENVGSEAIAILSSKAELLRDRGVKP